MVATYCSTDDVARFLGLTGFPSSGPITSSQVTSFIERMEDRVDFITGDSFKVKQVTEFKDVIRLDRKSGAGIPLYLDHENIYSLDDAENDALELWDGSTYNDILVSGTEGRAGDFWVDTKKGIVWLVDTSSTTTQGARITYRYGNYTSVPGDVRDATALMVAAQLIEQDGTTAILQEQGLAVTPIDRASSYRRRAEKMLQERRGWKAIGSQPSG